SSDSTPLERTCCLLMTRASRSRSSVGLWSGDRSHRVVPPRVYVSKACPVLLMSRLRIEVPYKRHGVSCNPVAVSQAWAPPRSPSPRNPPPATIHRPSPAKANPENDQEEVTLRKRRGSLLSVSHNCTSPRPP